MVAYIEGRKGSINHGKGHRHGWPGGSCSFDTGIGSGRDGKDSCFSQLRDPVVDTGPAIISLECKGCPICRPVVGLFIQIKDDRAGSNRRFCSDTQHDSHVALMKYHAILDLAHILECIVQV